MRFDESLIGEPIAVTYLDGDKVRVMFAIGMKGEPGDGELFDYHIIDSAKLEEDIAGLQGDSSDLLAELNAEIARATGIENGLQSELDATQASAGLSSEGEYVKNASANYISDAESLNDADVKLDEQLHVEELERKGLHLVKVTTGLDSNIREAYDLVDLAGNKVANTDRILIYKDSSLYTVYLGTTGDAIADPEAMSPEITPGAGNAALCFEYQLASGRYYLVCVDIEKYLHESEFKDGLKVNNHEVSVKIDANSEDYLTVSMDGIKLAGVHAEIVAAKQSEETRALTAEAALQANINNEVSRATAAEAQLQSNIDTVSANLDAEINRAEQADETLDDRIDVEKDRAMAAESTLNQKITEEKERAIAKENQLSTAITSEETRASAAETALSVEINEEISRATDAEGDIAADLTREVARAEAQEAALNSAIVSEASRATQAETTLNGLITNEVARATAKEAELESAISSSEGDLSDAINTEKTRAMAAEGALDTRIENLVNDRINVIDGNESTNGSFRKAVKDAKDSILGDVTTPYNTLEKIEKKIIANKVVAGDASIYVDEDVDGTEVSVKIDANSNALALTTNGLLSKLNLTYSDDKISLLANDTPVASIDTTGFTKDKLIKSAELVTVTEPDSTIRAPYIKIVWKTTEGEEITRIPLNGLIDAYIAGNGLNLESNVFSIKIAAASESYLTVDGEGLKVSGIDSAIATKVAAEKAERVQAVSDEASARSAKDAELAAAISAETSARAAAVASEASAREAEDTALGNRITSAISDRTAAINSEAATRSAADVALGNRIDTEVAARQAADAALENDIDANEQAITRLNGNYSDEGSVKKSILDATIGTVVTTISPEDAANQSLIRVIDGTGRFYVSNSANDIKYGATSVSSALDSINQDATDSKQRIVQLEQKIATAETRIAALEADLATAQGDIAELEATLNTLVNGNALNNKIKDVVLRLLEGYPKQIELKKYDAHNEETTSVSDTEKVKIKFAHDAEFLADVD